MNHNLVYVVGLGPGDAQLLTAQARAALQSAEVLCGYTVYGSWCGRFSRKGGLRHRHDAGDRPLPLGAGNRAAR